MFAFGKRTPRVVPNLRPARPEVRPDGGAVSEPQKNGIVGRPTFPGPSKVPAGDIEEIMKRVVNFYAGPAALPLPVLEKAQNELIDYAGSGMSVMELSHRSSEYEAINDRAEKGLRRLMKI